MSVPGTAMPGLRTEFEVVSDAGRAIGVEVRCRLDTVDVFVGGRCAAVLDRAVLTRWLACPVGVVAADDVAFGVVGEAQVGLSVAGVVASWILSPSDLAALRSLR